MDTDFQTRLLNRLEQSIDRLNERLDGFEKTITQTVHPVEARVQAMEIEIGQLKLIARAAVVVASVSFAGVSSMVMPSLFHQPVELEVRK
jgi:hypothetical protein